MKERASLRRTAEMEHKRATCLQREVNQLQTAHQMRGAEVSLPPPPNIIARNARGGGRQFAAGRGLAESNLHLFQPVQLRL
jgi:hypothetical protein